MPLNTPISHWIGFHLLLAVLLAGEFLYGRRRSNRPPLRTDATVRRTAVASTALWIAAALGFSLYIFQSLGSRATVEYLAGYAVEQSLSIDNLFLFLLLFRVFRIEPGNQPRVLFWGVAGAIIMRGIFVAAGIGLLQHFRWVSIVFGVILLLAAVRLLLPKAEGESERSPRWLQWLSRVHPVSLRQDAFFVRENGRRMATMLALSLVAIELTDVVFALDSIPAVLSITRHPFLAYTSNIMAVMGLRSLYFLLADLLSRLRYLHMGLASVLGFAAFKMLAAPWLEIGALTSLAVILGLLGVTIFLSLLKPAAA